MASIISWEKSASHCIILSLYVMGHFSLVVFMVFFVFGMQEFGYGVYKCGLLCVFF